MATTFMCFERALYTVQRSKRYTEVGEILLLRSQATRAEIYFFDSLLQTTSKKK